MHGRHNLGHMIRHAASGLRAATPPGRLLIASIIFTTIILGLVFGETLQALHGRTRS